MACEYVNPVDFTPTLTWCVTSKDCTPNPAAPGGALQLT